MVGLFCLIKFGNWTDIPANNTVIGFWRAFFTIPLQTNRRDHDVQRETRSKWARGREPDVWTVMKSNDKGQTWSEIKVRRTKTKTRTQRVK